MKNTRGGVAGTKADLPSPKHRKRCSHTSPELLADAHLSHSRVICGFASALQLHCALHKGKNPALCSFGSPVPSTLPGASTFPTCSRRDGSHPSTQTPVLSAPIRTLGVDPSGPGPRVQGPGECPALLCSQSHRRAAPTKGWGQGVLRGVRRGLATTGGFRLPIMGTSAMKTLRMELATLRDANKAA